MAYARPVRSAPGAAGCPQPIDAIYLWKAMLDPKVGFPVCFMGAQSLAQAVGALEGEERPILSCVGDHLEGLRRCCPFVRDSVPALFIDWATARWLARRGDYEEAIKLLDRTRAGFRGCRSEDWLSATGQRSAANEVSPLHRVVRRWCQRRPGAATVPR